MSLWDDARGTKEETLGRLFYPTAHNLAGRVACAYYVPLSYGAIAVASISPRLPWQWNLEACEGWILGDWTDNRPIAENLAKARRVLIDHDPSAIGWGNKTRSFALTITRPTIAGPVTLDVHSMGVLYGRCLTDRDLKILDRRGGYVWHTAPYRTAGRLLGELPQTIQAVTWYRWRHLNGIDRRYAMREEVF